MADALWQAASSPAKVEQVRRCVRAPGCRSIPAAENATGNYVKVVQRRFRFASKLHQRCTQENRRLSSLSSGPHVGHAEQCERQVISAALPAQGRQALIGPALGVAAVASHDYLGGKLACFISPPILRNHDQTAQLQRARRPVQMTSRTGRQYAGRSAALAC